MEEFQRQHEWNIAREAALIRDGYACQRCNVLTVGKFPSDWESLPSAPVRPQWNDYDDHEAFQEAMEVWKAQWKLFTIRVVKPLMPEVNHKEPLVGKGYAWGCVHHAENLETLCHRCHVRTTKQQRMERKLAGARKVYEEEIRNGRRSAEGSRVRQVRAAPGEDVSDAVGRIGEEGLGSDEEGFAEAG